MEKRKEEGWGKIEWKREEDTEEKGEKEIPQEGEENL